MKTLRVIDWTISLTVVGIIGAQANWWYAGAALATFGWLRLQAWSVVDRL